MTAPNITKARGRMLGVATHQAITHRGRPSSTSTEKMKSE